MKGRNPSGDDAKTSVNAGMMVVESLAVAVAEPLPDALTWFANGDATPEATLTVTVTGG